MAETEEARTHSLEAAQEDAPTGHATLTVAIGVAMSVAVLYLAREVLVPLTLSALLSFALSPPMLWMRRNGMPRVPSVAVVVTLAFVGIFGLGRLVVLQVSALADNLPVYQQNLEQKIKSVQGAAGDSGVLSRAADMLRNLNQQLDGSAPPVGMPTGPIPGKPSKPGAKTGFENNEANPPDSRPDPAIGARANAAGAKRHRSVAGTAGDDRPESWCS